MKWGITKFSIFLKICKNFETYIKNSKIFTFLMFFMSKMTPKIDVLFREPRPTNDTDRPKMPHKCHYNKGGIGRYIPGFGY